jgi:hypothetical protein
MNRLTIFCEVNPLPKHVDKAKEAYKATYGETVDIKNEDILADCLFNFAYSCSVFEGKRNNKNFKYADYLALDIDQGQSIRGVVKVLQQLNLLAYIGSTTSHQKDKNGHTCDRFRVILPLETRIDTEAKFRATMDYLADYFNYDPQCKDPARFYFACEEIAKIDGMPLRTMNIKPKKVQKTAKNNIFGEKKGQLSLRTRTFLEEGSDNWHIDYLIACRDMKSQGYSRDEIIELFDDNGWTLDAKHDIPQLDYVLRDDTVVFDYREEWTG